MAEIDSIPVASSLPRSIPDQLHNCRFIRVASKGKHAIDYDWPGLSNYDITDPNLTGHLINGGNYGILPRDGICILDADDESKLQDFIEVIGETLTVRTKKGLHLYFKCDGLEPTKVVLFDPLTGDHVGELYPSGCRAYCLGPGCLHPSGSVYEVETQSDIVTVSLEAVKRAVSFYSRPKRSITDQVENKPQKAGYLPLSDVLGLRIESVAPPSGNIQHLSNGEIRGSNPWHGSESGTNYAINAQKNTWHCFRCDSGGDPATALAVKYRLIQCHEAGPGCLTADVLAKIESKIREGEEGPVYQKSLIERDIEWKRSQTKKTISPTSNNSNRPGNNLVQNLPGHYNLTDVGNAERFCFWHGDSVKYCPTLKEWFIWNGAIWARDDINKRDLLAIDTVRRIYGEASTEPDEGLRVKIAAWATKSEEQNRRNNLLQTASSMLAISQTKLDARPELFNLRNGTYNLITHEFRDHQQEDLLTKLAGVEYYPDATCETWLNHLNLVFGGDENLINGFQELAGYSLLSGNPAEIFCVAWGSGRNGKGKTFDAITHVFGDYAGNTPFTTFTVSKYGGGRGSASPEIVDMIGCRFIRASESEDGATLSEALIKNLTGGDLITARGLYKGLVTFKPEFTIFLQTNHKPIIQNWDQAIEARLWLVPFNTFIPPENRDYHILDKLIAEGSGIFNWMLEGLKRYQAHGWLRIPDMVKQATEEYRMEQDRIGEFTQSLCVKEGWCYRKDLYTAYYQDCYQNGVEPVSQNMFSRLLQSHHGVKEGHRKENGRTWQGIKLRSSNDTPDTFFKKGSADRREEVNKKNVSHVSNSVDKPPLLVDARCIDDISHDTSDIPDTYYKSMYTRENIEKEIRPVSVVTGVSDWLQKYKLPQSTPVTEYILMPVEMRHGMYCACAGCSNPDRSQPRYYIPEKYVQICEKHYSELKTAIDRQEGRNNE